MAVPTTTLWPRDLHTAAKHAILKRYLAAWFPIIARSFSDKGLTFVDAFAGPGEYDDTRADGSPMVALYQAHRPDVTQHRARVRLLFIEANPKRCSYLQALVDAKYPEVRRPDELTVRVVCGECGNKLIPGLAEIGGQSAPIFVNFDGWGIDTPFRLVKVIGRMAQAEVMITFATQQFVRFAKNEDARAGDRVFGGREWRDLVLTSQSPGEKKERLVTLYRRILRDAGFPLVLTFELVDERSHAFLLIYGSSSEVGLTRMKDAMWQVDTVTGSRFRDPRDVNQTILELNEGPNLTLLENQILAELKNVNSPVSLTHLKRFALLETLFRATHAVTAVNNLERNGAVTCIRKPSHEDTLVTLAPMRLF